MASQIHELHFLIIPLMSQSQLIPMTDFARLIAQRGPLITIITTPLNATRFQPIVDRARKSGLKIQLIPLSFPCHEAGLPKGCENMDTITSPDLVKQFLVASELLQEPLAKCVAGLQPRPSCLITSNAVPWTEQISKNFNIPRYIFNPISCFDLLCIHNISLTNLDTESIVVPNMPLRIEFTKSQLPDLFRKDSSPLNELLDRMREALLSAQGILINSFEEMESWFVEEYKKEQSRNNVWCIGPVSLCNKNVSDKFDRGNKASIDEHHFLKWLDSRNPSSVIYACFGSLCHISPPQLIEIGLGLEASNRPFIWIIRGADYSAEVEKWLKEERFEKRNEEKGLIIRGWAPQVLILSHAAIGGFLTHCGWNSTLEGVCAGVPMITWPMFAEQFINEKFVTHVLRIGVGIGVEVAMQWGEEEKVGVLVKREQVKKAVEVLMSGEEGEERRKRAREFREMAKRAVEEGGSSYFNMNLLIENVIHQISV